MSNQHSVESDTGSCDWCYHPLSAPRPFDCINPTHVTPPVSTPGAAS